MRSNYLENLIAIAFGITLAAVLLEVFLRIYNPFPTRIKGDKIILPANRKYVFENIHVAGLDTYIVHTKNALGFRGEENEAANFNGRTKVFVVGGSTTECLYLSDGQDWPNLAGEKIRKSIPGLWLNNAGLDGHSTFGHTLLVQDYLLKLKPDYIVFLVGTNDVERADLDKFDSMHIRNYSKHRNWKGKLVEHSELANLVHNFYAVYKANDKNITHFSFKLSQADTFELPASERQKALAMQQEFLPKYRQRIDNLIKICQQNNIKPVFVTQPYLLGFGTDAATGANLARIKIGKRDGATQWQILQLYNSVTIQACNERNIPVINLADKMPKQSVYFYDQAHFTKAGARKVAEIVAAELLPYMLAAENAFANKQNTIL